MRARKKCRDVTCHLLGYKRWESRTWTVLSNNTVEKKELLWIHSFPLSAVTNYNKLVSQNNTNLSFYGSGVVQKLKMHLEQCALSGSSRIEFISCLQLLEAAPVSWFTAPHDSHFSHILTSPSLTLTLLPPVSPGEHIAEVLGWPWPALRIQGNRPISGFLASSAKSLLLY